MRLNSFARHPSFRRQHGTALVAVLGMIALVSIAFSAILGRAMSTYRQTSHIASWQEALLASEAGSETALAELRRTIISETAFAQWTKVKADGTDGELVGANPGSRIIEPPNFPAGGLRFKPPQLVHNGEMNTKMDTVVTLDAPPELFDAENKRQWFRVRAVGTTYLPGSISVTGDKLDHDLRRLAFHRNPKTNLLVDRPQSSRALELVAKPVGMEKPVVSDRPLMINNHKIVTDSYDSRYPSRSTNGLYDPAKAGKNGDVATNSQLIDAGNASINGDAYTNSGVVENGSGVTGKIYDDFYIDLPKIPKPTWGTGTYAVLNGSATATPIVGGSTDQYNPTRYKLGGAGGLSVTGGAMTFVAPATAPANVEHYIDLWVPGDFKTAGTGSIVIGKNMNVRFYVEGDIDIKGNGTFNQNSQPARLQILCVSPVPYTPRNIYVSGNGIIVAAIYGPDHDVVFGATGSAGTMWGAIVGRSISMGGTTYIHYDEALAEKGKILDYRITNWFEDSK